MKRKSAIPGPALIVLTFFWLSNSIFTGCSKENPGDRGIGETAFHPRRDPAASSFSDPLSLHLVVNDTYCMETACECIYYLASRHYNQVISKLKKDYNIDLQLTYCLEESDMEDSLMTGKYDGAICKPWLAFRHSGQGMKFTRVADVLDPFDNELLRGIFIVKKDSPLKEPSDINGKILAMGKEDSYEKYHMAMELLQKDGIKPGRILHKSICTEGINALLDNKADVAVISDYALVASCAVDFVDKDAFRTILETGDIPLTSVILDLDRISRRDAAKLQYALLKLSSEGMPKDFNSKGFVKPVSWVPEPWKNE